MSAQTEALPEPIHPAPERRKVSMLSLVLGLAVPPLVWSAQSILGYAISSNACFPGDSLLRHPVLPHLRPLLAALNCGALAMAVMSFGVAYRSWSLTRFERGGDSGQLIDQGEGRTRFLAVCGMLVGAGFGVAILFSSISLLLSPLCR